MICYKKRKKFCGFLKNFRWMGRRQWWRGLQKKWLFQKEKYVRIITWSNRVAGWLTFILHRMGVVLMDKKHFDFKDLMQFGMFILSLLTFIYLICHQYFSIEKPPQNFGEQKGGYSVSLLNWSTTCGRLFLFYVLIIAYSCKQVNKTYCKRINFYSSMKAKM